MPEFQPGIPFSVGGFLKVKDQKRGFSNKIRKNMCVIIIPQKKCNYVLITAQGLHAVNEVNIVSVGSNKSLKKKKLQNCKFNIYDNTHKSIRKKK